MASLMRPSRNMSPFEAWITESAGNDMYAVRLKMKRLLLQMTARDTESYAIESLRGFLMSLPDNLIPVAISTLLGDMHDSSSSARCERIVLVGTLLRIHSDMVRKHINGIVKLIIGRFSETDSGAREELANLFSMLVAHVFQPDIDGKGLCSSIVEPLIAVFSTPHKNKSVQRIAAMCLQKVVAAVDSRYISRDEIAEILHRIAHLLGNVKTRVAELQLPLQRCVELLATTEGGLKSGETKRIVQRTVGLLNSSNDTNMRRLAVETLFVLAVVLGDDMEGGINELSEYIPSIVRVLKTTTSDRVAAVADVAKDCLQLYQKLCAEGGSSIMIDRIACQKHAPEVKRRPPTKPQDIPVEIYVSKQKRPQGRTPSPTHRFRQSQDASQEPMPTHFVPASPPRTSASPSRASLSSCSLRGSESPVVIERASPPQIVSPRRSESVERKEAIRNYVVKKVQEFSPADATKSRSETPKNNSSPGKKSPKSNTSSPPFSHVLTDGALDKELDKILEMQLNRITAHHLQIELEKKEKLNRAYKDAIENLQKRLVADTMRVEKETKSSIEQELKLFKKERMPIIKNLFRVEHGAPYDASRLLSHVQTLPSTTVVEKDTEEAAAQQAISSPGAKNDPLVQALDGVSPKSSRPSNNSSLAQLQAEMDDLRRKLEGSLDA